MTRRFFEGVKDVQELRKKYKELLKQYHPDNGGSVEIMHLQHLRHSLCSLRYPLEVP